MPQPTMPSPHIPQQRSSANTRRGSKLVKSRKTHAAASEEASAAALTLQFLDFVGDGRTYGETMEAWRSNCPRMPIWEDAVRDGLVRIENGGTMKSSRIVLTARGIAHLHQHKP
jgi:D-3-phosphoglycerate dehydrogenase